jgi:hypothetical protein
VRFLLHSAHMATPLQVELRIKHGDKLYHFAIEAPHYNVILNEVKNLLFALVMRRI